MNLEVAASQTVEANSAAFNPRLHLFPSGRHIERDEFERLLQRAMELLNARHIEEQLARKTA
jgi:hypothetical protein